MVVNIDSLEPVTLLRFRSTPRANAAEQSGRYAV